MSHQKTPSVSVVGSVETKKRVLGAADLPNWVSTTAQKSFLELSLHQGSHPAGIKNLVSDTGVINGPRKQFCASIPETTKPQYYCLQWSVWGKGKDITSYVFGGKKVQLVAALSIFHISTICFNAHPRFRSENIFAEKGKIVEVLKNNSV